MLPASGSPAIRFLQTNPHIPPTPCGLASRCTPAPLSPGFQAGSGGSFFKMKLGRRSGAGDRALGSARKGEGVASPDTLSPVGGRLAAARMLRTPLLPPLLLSFSLLVWRRQPGGSLSSCRPGLPVLACCGGLASCAALHPCPWLQGLSMQLPPTLVPLSPTLPARCCSAPAAPTSGSRGWPPGGCSARCPRCCRRGCRPSWRSRPSRPRCLRTSGCRWATPAF